MIRIGIGYDIHRLVCGRKLFIGGVRIPFKSGLLGHSDGDVLLHAVCDALLGASALGDIGKYFPDTDPKYKDISSIKLLKKVNNLIKKDNLAINNIDTIIIAEEPKILLFQDKIKQSIAAALKVKKGSISIKAKTNEGLGVIGNKKAIACYAVVTLISKEG